VYLLSILEYVMISTICSIDSLYMIMTYKAIGHICNKIVICCEFDKLIVHIIRFMKKDF